MKVPIQTFHQKVVPVIMSLFRPSVIQLLCFRHLSDFFCMALDIEEVNLQTFVMITCKTICRKYLFPIHKKFYSSHCFF